MKTSPSLSSILAVSLLLGACSSAPSAASETLSPSAQKTTVPAPRTTAPQTPGLIDDLRAAGIDRAEILSSVIGDLNGDGRPDVLVVLNPASTNKAAADRGPRTVLLMVRDTDGSLHRLEQSDRIIPCESCGGLSGDPFAYARIDKDGFTLRTEGGSRERWWNEFAFKYAAKQKTWVLVEVKEGNSDAISGRSKEVRLTTKDFGSVTFGSFDPDSLPSFDLP